MSEVLSVNRHEDKYEMDFCNAIKLKNRLTKILKVDEHSREIGYVVRSLYFDTINNNDYNQKFAGIENRKKIRLRAYEVKSGFCKLEMKKKIGENQCKISLLIDKTKADEIINGNYGVLLDDADDNSTALSFYKEMTLGCYRPATIIEYKREAYTFDLYRTRITFDYDVMASERCVDFFSEDIGEMVPVLKNRLILEVKYDGTLPRYISKALEPFDLFQQSYSKYCNGRIRWDDYL